MIKMNAVRNLIDEYKKGNIQPLEDLAISASYTHKVDIRGMNGAENPDRHTFHNKMLPYDNGFIRTRRDGDMVYIAAAGVVKEIYTSRWVQNSSGLCYSEYFVKEIQSKPFIYTDVVCSKESLFDIVTRDCTISQSVIEPTILEGIYRRICFFPFLSCFSLAIGLSCGAALSYGTSNVGIPLDEYLNTVHYLPRLISYRGDEISTLKGIGLTAGLLLAVITNLMPFKLYNGFVTMGEGARDYHFGKNAINQLYQEYKRLQS